jgi:hypothetical protein
MEGADQVGLETVDKILVSHAMQGPEANVADAMREAVEAPSRQRRLFNDGSRSRGRRAIALHLQMTVAIRRLQTSGIPARKHQVDAIRFQASGQRLSEAAAGAGDQQGGHGGAIGKWSGQDIGSRPSKELEKKSGLTYSSLSFIFVQDKPS